MVKTLGGRGRLTNKEIDKLQIYYGLAIRRNIGNLEGMKNDISAILRHRLSTDDMPNHSKCPKGDDTWCLYQKDPGHYKHKSPLPKAVSVHIKPVFDRLSTNELLERCLDGYTQNASESFNGLLWNICPKGTFVGSKPLNISASLAVCIYYDGYQSLISLIKKLGISCRKSCIKVLYSKDKERIYQSKRKVNEKEKKIRQARRERRLAEEDRNREIEGDVYEYGGF